MNLICFARKKNEVARIDYHCISDDPKHDTRLWPKTLRAVVVQLLEKNPETVHFEVTTDTSKKEFKSVPICIPEDG